MKQSDAQLHVRGLSAYVDDTDFPENGLYCAFLFSKTARGEIQGIDKTEAEQTEGVRLVLTAGDIPGENQIGGIIQDEPLLASDRVDYIGQPVAAVFASDERTARKAAAKIRTSVREEDPVLDPRTAFERNELIAPVRTFSIGDAGKAVEKSAYIVSGSVESGAQEHFYLESQAAIAYPVEGGGLRVYSSTQSPTAVQKTIANVCGLPMNAVEVDVRRLGGAFGGKEDQASSWACFAALGARLTGRPCRVVLRRTEDMTATGKRHPYSSDFTMGLDESGMITGYKVMYYQNAGAAADLSTAILERTLFHATASYYVPNVSASAASCRTNIAPFTAFRGFGGPQAMFVFESALREASKASGIPVEELQKRNLLKEGDVFPYGQKAENVRALRCWDRAYEKYGLMKRMREIDSAENGRYGKGYALMPVCFGISFTNTSLNQARALVHVYTDGSVGVSTGAVEMGQGVNQKIRDIVSVSFGIPLENIKTETTNTTRVSNTSPTAASSGSDLNGKAAEMACLQILGGILTLKASNLDCGPKDLSFRDGTLFRKNENTGISWYSVIQEAYAARVHLSAEAHFATPELFFDKETEKGNPFAYHAYGTAYIEASVDRLLGTYDIDNVLIVHDIGESINETIDLGQIEGGLAQGIGWLTMEEMRYAPDGTPVTATAGTYKVPDMGSSPGNIETEFLPDAGNPKAVLNSKAVGEPPFMYGIGAYFAIMKAAGIKNPKYIAPLTPEQLLSEIIDQQRA